MLLLPDGVSAGDEVLHPPSGAPLGRPAPAPAKQLGNRAAPLPNREQDGIA